MAINPSKARLSAKACSRCGEVKPHTAVFFYADRGALRADCRPCVVAAHRARNETKRRERAAREALLPKPAPPTSKRCTRCGVDKPATAECYGSGVRLLATCRQCRAAECRARYRLNRDIEKARAATRYRANRDRNVALRRKWTERNYKRQRTAITAWNREHPESLRTYSHTRRARHVAAVGTFTPEDIQRIYAEQAGLCFYCRIALNGDYEIEHKTPLARQGSNWPENLCCACTPCNRRKRTRTAAEFFAELHEAAP